MSADPIPVFDHASPPLSQETFDRLKAEHDDLVTRGKIDIARKIETARELGDLSENGDYHAAKEEQGKMAGRINHLANLLENSEIVDLPSRIVSVRFEGDSGVERYLLGLVDEQVEDLEILSPGSALGQALMGKTAGETVEYETPTGAKLKVEIVTIGT